MHGYHGLGFTLLQDLIHTLTQDIYITHPPNLCGTSFTKTHSDTCNGTVLGLDLVLDLFDRLEVFDRLDPQLVCCVLTISSAFIQYQ